MKKSFAKKAAIFGLLLFCGAAILLFGFLRSFFASFDKEQTTTQEAAIWLKDSEKLKRVNQDAIAILNRIGTNGSALTGVMDSDLANYPAISDLVSRLGNYASVAVIPQSAEIYGFPAQVRVRFGSHSHCHFLFIVDGRVPFEQKGVFTNCIQVSTNVFIRE